MVTVGLLRLWYGRGEGERMNDNLPLHSGHSSGQPLSPWDLYIDGKVCHHALRHSGRDAFSRAIILLPRFENTTVRR